MTGKLTTEAVTSQTIVTLPHELLLNDECNEGSLNSNLQTLCTTISHQLPVGKLV